MEHIEILKQLISIPSFSGEEKEAANFLENYLKEKSYPVKRKGNNLWLVNADFDASKPNLLLNAHIDTVRPVQSWQGKPFEARLENGKLYGLGSNDDGVSVVALMQAFFRLTSKSQPYNLILALTAEEEISGKNGFESILNELPKIDFAVVGEPTGMNLAVAERGLMVLDCTAHGKAGHAARNEGENAIYKAMLDIQWFKNFRFAKKSDFLGETKMTVTQISAGSQHNVIPDRCSFVVDVRPNELYTNEEILAEIKKNVCCQVLPRSTRLRATATPLCHPVIQRGQEIGLPLFGSQTLSDQALMPFPSVKIGAGDSARSHTADEFICLEEIDNAIEIYIKLLNQLTIKNV